ncbi:MAG: FeoB-associated Cys-rich membrane protein [Parafannyhessea sp.]|uniref:FeoB-associated Cys-rich membrane protein n=1 Tax=Parafannyhessea sp. TaxID=2847324 RepID=UPI003EFF663C
MLLNVIIVVAIAVAFVLCVRSLAKGGGSCSSCAQEATCPAHAGGAKTCPVAKDMVAKADAALTSTGKRK